MNLYSYSQKSGVSRTRQTVSEFALFWGIFLAFLQGYQQPFAGMQMNQQEIVFEKPTIFQVFFAAFEFMLPNVNCCILY